MSDGNIRPVLAGQKALVIGIANDEFDRLRLREGLSHYGRRPRDHMAQ